jgi:hypothetical protein
MSGKFFVRVVMGLATCVVAFATSEEAEAARWHRRHRCDPCYPCCTPVCCEPVCCEPVCCEPVCCEPVCVSTSTPSCCGPAYETVACYDSCGRLVQRRVACCETIVSATIIVPATSCCGIASTGSADAQSLAETRAKESLAVTTALVVK